MIAREPSPLDGEPLIAPRLVHPQLGAPVAEYDYARVSGDVAFVVARFLPKDFRCAQPRGDAWVWHLNGTPALLYRLPDVERALAAGETIYLVDGEKDADALAAAGVCATCSARAQGFTLEHAEQLTGARRIRIVADADGGTGERQARDAAAMLVNAGAIASCDVEIVQSRTGKDSADHLEAGHTVDEFELIHRLSDAPNERQPHRVVSLEQFVAEDEGLEEPLIGTEEKKLVTANSNTVFHGEGGSGKTTLAIDFGFHAAAGDAWLGFEIGRPLTVMVIENEGPRAEYRFKLRRKLATWQGASVAGRIVVHEHPWGRVDLRDNEHVAAIATAVRLHDVDVLLAGPIRRLGLEGGGTPAETVSFMALLDRVRDAAGRPLAIVLVHHDNKLGDISGAFEAEFDTVVHVKPDGRDRTQLYFRKSRWSSRIHRSRATLAWITASEGFQVVETDIDADQAAGARDAEEAQTLDWIVSYVEHHYADTAAGITRGKVETAYKDAHPDRGSRARARRVIDRQKALAVQLENGVPSDPNGEHSPHLAVGDGEKPSGTYLFPLNHAPSPLAVDLTASTANTSTQPPQETPLATSPPPVVKAANGEHQAARVTPEDLTT